MTSSIFIRLRRNAVTPTWLESATRTLRVSFKPPCGPSLATAPKRNMPKSADKMSTPRVEVELKATRVCYLSNGPPFEFVLRRRSHDIDEQVVPLHDGFAGVEGYQPINSPRVFQCFDCETGKEVQVVHQGIQPLFLGRVHYTSSSTRESYELPFVTSSLEPDRKYRLCFRSNLISYWPAIVKEVQVPRDITPGSLSFASYYPAPSTPGILWEAADGKDPHLKWLSLCQLHPLIRSLSSR
jgi:hypothetical protein